MLSLLSHVPQDPVDIFMPTSSPLTSTLNSLSLLAPTCSSPLESHKFLGIYVPQEQYLANEGQMGGGVVYKYSRSLAPDYSNNAVFPSPLQTVPMSSSVGLCLLSHTCMSYFLETHPNRSVSNESAVQELLPGAVTDSSNLAFNGLRLLVFLSLCSPLC